MSRRPMAAKVFPFTTMNLAAGAAHVVWEVGNPATGHYCLVTGRELIFANNTGTGPEWVRLVTAEDEARRSGSTGQLAVAPGETLCLAVSPARVWGHPPDRRALIDVSSNNVRLAAVRYP